MTLTSTLQRPQTRRAARSGAEPIDHEVLGTLLCADQEAVGAVLRQFYATCPADARALAAALSGDDYRAALRGAHRLKGACRMIGATLLADACERAEIAARAGNTNLVAAAVSDIDREFARVIKHLDQWLKANS